MAQLLIEKSPEKTKGVLNNKDLEIIGFRNNKRILTGRTNLSVTAASFNEVCPNKNRVSSLISPVSKDATSLYSSNGFNSYTKKRNL